MPAGGGGGKSAPSSKSGGLFSNAIAASRASGGKYVRL